VPFPLSDDVLDEHHASFDTAAPFDKLRSGLLRMRSFVACHVPENEYPHPEERCAAARLEGRTDVSAAFPAGSAERKTTGARTRAILIEQRQEYATIDPRRR
jgi:hypothetical protein